VTLVGDDVVDLDEPAIATSHRRARFVERVLGPGERAQLVGAGEPKALLWAFFAAKEAAYKVLCKLGPPPVLGHRRFEVAEDLKSVRNGERELRLQVSWRGSLVHAVAWLGGDAAPSAATRTLEPGADASLAARALLIAELGGEPGLTIVRPPRPRSWDGFGPPHASRLGLRLPVDVSLSHDGRYVGCAFLSSVAG
jgi:phosphopantetheinyl transferase (holo-ACP synthase)